MAESSTASAQVPLPALGPRSAPPDALRCCCGQADCVFLRYNCSVLDSVEKDVHNAAKVGQVSIAARALLYIPLPAYPFGRICIMFYHPTWAGPDIPARRADLGWATRYQSLSLSRDILVPSSAAQPRRRHGAHAVLADVADVVPRTYVVANLCPPGPSGPS